MRQSTMIDPFGKDRLKTSRGQKKVKNEPIESITLESPEVIAARKKAQMNLRKKGRKSTMVSNINDKLGLVTRPMAREATLLGG